MRNIKYVNPGTIKVLKREISLLTKNNRIPSVGDTFYYESKYSDNIVEGIVKIVGKGNIVSKNGTTYNFDEITIKHMYEIRNDAINAILLENNQL